MPQKIIEVEGVGPVTLYKKRGAKHVRLSVNADGRARVTMPSWAPYQLGIDFIKSKVDWLKENVVKNQPDELEHGLKVGKAHRLEFELKASTRVSTSVSAGKIKVYVPFGTAMNDPKVQTLATKACERALKAEAETLLPQRLQQLSGKSNLGYTSVKIQRLKSRWGSCNQAKEIVLNLYLMQLPWDLIDYVLLHELTHTKIMAHGSVFWTEMENHVANLASKRKRIKQYQPRLRPMRPGDVPIAI